MSLTCSRCGTVWPDEIEEGWGQAEETVGYGPRPRCVAIVEARNGASEWCSGRLSDSNKKPTANLTFDGFVIGPDGGEEA